MTKASRRLLALAAATATMAALGPGVAVAVARSAPTPPRHAGALRIAGSLRDGSVVKAAGLTWRPGRLPAGDRLLSFAVAYTWQSCARRCLPGADTTVAPFAARRYIVGHADTGRRLRLTETATEVVQTKAADFTFVALSSSASVSSRGHVAAYAGGRAPRTEFVNGVPERTTGSDAEYFGVDPPHFATGDGQVRQWYRVDSGRWHPMPRSQFFATGKLRVGRHSVAVRTADRAGATVLRFDWRVVPLPAPAPCRGRCWLPPHLDRLGQPMRWDWQIGRTTPLQRTGKRAVDIYDIDGFLTTAAQVHAIRTRWQGATLRHPRTACYLDLAWEDYRPDGSPGHVFPAAALGNVYFGYPQERWVDFRQLNELKPMIDERLKMCARKGFDAVELDDIDSFDPPSTTGFHLTPGDAQNLLAYAFNEIHRLGLAGLWKNSPFLSWWGRRYADGAVVEECYIYHACFASWQRGSSQYGITCTALFEGSPCGWDDFSTDKTRTQPTGKWVGEVEYAEDGYVCDPGQSCKGPHRFAAFCRTVYAPGFGFSALKLDVNLDGATFLPCPAGR